MTVSHAFEAYRSHERFKVRVRAEASGAGSPYLQVTVEDSKSKSFLCLTRPELMPLLAAVKEAIKEVEDAAAGLPSDPVERAALRIPGSGMAMSMQRGHIIRSYNQEVAELRERYLERIDGITAQRAAGQGGSGAAGP